MKETELKILDVQILELQQKLQDLGAQDLGEVFVEAWILDTPDQCFKEKKELLRVRTIGDDAYVTFKHSFALDGELKVMEEEETTVGDAKIMVELFCAMGYQVTHRIQKYRHTYRVADVELVIDRHPRIPPYLELEGEKEAIFVLMDKLGYHPEDGSSETAYGILKRHGIEDTEILFDE